jgi:hypothetical protein
MTLTKCRDSCEKKSETGCKEGASMTRIDPSQVSRETGTVGGANFATPQCGGWNEDEWQELLARLSTGCKV